MDEARRLDDSFKQYFDVKKLDPAQGIRRPMSLARVSSARSLIEDSIFGFSAPSPLSDAGVDCTQAHAYFRHDGLFYLNARLETGLTVPVFYVIGFAFKGSGMAAVLGLALNYPGLNGHQVFMLGNSSWLKAQYNDAEAAGLVFRIKATTDLNLQRGAVVQSWANSFPSSSFPSGLMPLGDGGNSASIDQIIAAGGDPFDNVGGDGG
jgi:hypothetical protein